MEIERTDRVSLDSFERFKISGKCKTCGDARISLWSRPVGVNQKVEITVYCQHCKTYESAYVGY